MLAGLHAEEDVTIDRLQVKRAAVDSGALQQALTRESWPRADGRSWVFIRQINVTAPRSRIVKEIVDHTRRLISGAQSGSINSNVIRFVDLNDLLARLMADLINGRASRCWYWQRWSHLFQLSPGCAVAKLMSDHIEYLPALTTRLARQQTLRLVWRTLGRDDARQLSKTLAWRVGLHLPVTDAPKTQPEPLIPALALPAEIKARWESVLAPLPQDHPRFRLALILIACETWPVLLQKAPYRLLSALTKVFAGPAGVPLRPVSTASPSVDLPASSARIDRDADFSDQASLAIQMMQGAGADDTAQSAGTAKGHEPDTPLERASMSSPMTDPEPIREPAAVQSIQPAESAGPTAATTAPGISRPAAMQELVPMEAKKTDRNVPWNAQKIATGSSGPLQRLRLREERVKRPFDSFRTRQGGLFYLLNFLNREEVQALLAATKENCRFPSGWGWLLRLGQELSLDQTDPVAIFLARQMGLAGVEELDLLPALPARNEILDLARRWYGPGDLWNSRLLELDARVHFTPSHVDWYAPVKSIRLAVRLAGLDINPGWLPWLGRVVTFYYRL
jgi:hypothetical protein